MEKSLPDLRRLLRLSSKTKKANLAAMQGGSDRRITRLPDDSQVRLLTYRADVSGGPAFYRRGVLCDQQRVMSQFLTALWILGGLSVFLLGDVARGCWSFDQTCAASLGAAADVCFQCQP